MRVDLPEIEKDGVDANRHHPNLKGTSRIIASLANHPAAMLYGMMVPVVLVAWVWMVFAAQQMASSNPGASLGPAMLLLEPLLRNIDLNADYGWITHVISIGTPSALSTTLTAHSVGAMFTMWLVMSVAMMLPSATPMLRTYADIADTAARQQQYSVPVVFLAVGYLTIWLGFAIAATLLQSILIIAGQSNSISAPLVGYSSGGILVFAGLYQFSSLKHACLVKCRNPFTTLFGRWSNNRGNIFRLGLQQGWFCLGCCWAIMLVMLSVGMMNLIWMAILTLFTLLEKTSSGVIISRVFGTVLLAWGLYLVLISANLTFY